MKKMIRRAGLIAVCLSLFGWTGCSGKKESSGGQRAEPVAITYWYWAEQAEYTIKMKDIAQDFNAVNDQNIQVTAIKRPWDGGAYSEQILAAAMSGGAPDTAAWVPAATPAFMKSGLLAELDGYVNNWDSKEDIGSFLYNGMQQAGRSNKLYVLPWTVRVFFVYYRPSMFQMAKIEVPQSYADFLKACRELTRDIDGDRRTDVYGFGMCGAQGGQDPWGSFIRARGGNFSDFTSPQAVQGMEDFIGLYRDGYAQPSAPADGLGETLARFAAGETAMTVHYSGSAAFLESELNGDVNGFVFPSGIQQWAALSNTGNVIFEACENKDAAFEWLAYLSAGKGQESWCEATKNIPASKRIQTMPLFQQDKFFQLSTQAAGSGGIFPAAPDASAWLLTTWPETVHAALTGQITARQAMEALQKGMYP